MREWIGLACVFVLACGNGTTTGSPNGGPAIPDTRDGGPPRMELPCSGGQCQCSQGGCATSCKTAPCEAQCSGGDCALTCPPTGMCDLQCSGGKCVNYCGVGACNVQCSGGGCNTSCPKGATCTIDCSGGNCLTACAEGATCIFKSCSNCTCTGAGCPK